MQELTFEQRQIYENAWIDVDRSIEYPLGPRIGEYVQVDAGIFGIVENVSYRQVALHQVPLTNRHLSVLIRLQPKVHDWLIKVDPAFDQPAHAFKDRYKDVDNAIAWQLDGGNSTGELLQLVCKPDLDFDPERVNRMFRKYGILS
jgi:hypothetical protein